MNDQNTTSPHPEAEILGAFVEGTLDTATTAEVTAHIAGCNDCLAVVAGTARMRREETREEVRRWEPRRTAWFAAAAAVVIGLVGLVTFRKAILEPTPSALDALRAAAPSDRRYVEARLTGFAWAPVRTYRDDTTATTDAGYLRLAGAAGEALRAAQRDGRAADRLQAAGVGQLLVRQPETAATWLQKAASADPRDASAWSDLCAAQLSLALEHDRPSYLPAALASADRALAIDARLPEALFNRALVLEHLGIREDAAAAWRAYLAVDGASQWAHEAREHLQRLSAAARPAFRDRVPEIENVALAGDDRAVERIVDGYRQEARAWYEVEGLGQWAEAQLANDGTTAQRKLAAAARVAAAIERLSGESLLSATVRVITSADARTIRGLAAGHAQYREGRLLFSRHSLGAAESTLASAERALAAHQSPMALVARYYRANVLFDQSRVPEALELLRQLERDAVTPALRAQARGQIGLCELYAGRWSSAIDVLASAREDFARLGEEGFAGSMESKLAEAYEFLVRRDEAWRHRVAAFRALSGQPARDRMIAALAGASRAESQAGRYGAALSLLDVELRQIGSANALAAGDAWRRRAMVQSRLGNPDLAGADLRQGRAALAAAGESELRRRVDTELSVVEAGVLRRNDSARADDLYTKAIEYFENAGHRVFLPATLLERARARREAGRAADAAADLEAGIAELESQRRATSSAELRARLFDQQSELLEEAVPLALERGDVVAAFAYADRAHGRTLLDRLAGEGDERALVGRLREQLGPGQAVVEAMLVPDGLAMFVVTTADLRVFRQPVARELLAEGIASFRASIERRDDDATIRSQAAGLYRQLVEPLRGALRGASELVIVGDRFLESGPWAALHDGRHWLVEDVAITVAPSAAVWARQSRRLRAGRTDSVLLIADGGGNDLDALPWTAREAEAIGALYGRHHLLTDPTPERIVAMAGDFDVLHFSGHARSGSGDDAALLFSSGEGARPLSATTIESLRLPRTSVVVLAACGTARGDTSRLDGMPSLARAFLAAGVPSVVGSIWPLEDAEAAAVVTTFHRRLRDGQDPSRALRDAQLLMLHGSKAAWRHPAAWAGIEVRGASVKSSVKRGA